METNLQREIYGESLVRRFNGYLQANTPAIKYLNARGVSENLIDTMQIGYCPPFYNFWFPLMRGRITVPIRDSYGKLLAFAGRIYEPSRDATLKQIRDMYGNRVADGEKAVDKWESAKWINEPYAKGQHLFNLNRAKNVARQSGYIVIVEGYFDAQILAQEGILETVALCGTGLSDKHCILLSRYVEHVVFVLDGDDAGENALTKMIPKAKEIGLIPHAIYLPKGYDPDEFVLRIHGNKFRELLDTTIKKNLDEFVIKIEKRK